MNQHPRSRRVSGLPAAQLRVYIGAKAREESAVSRGRRVEALAEAEAEAEVVAVAQREAAEGESLNTAQLESLRQEAAQASRAASEARRDAAEVRVDSQSGRRG